MTLTDVEIKEVVNRLRDMLDDKYARALELSDILITGSGIISERPIWVYAIIVVASNAAYSEFAFRNGETAADTSKLNVTAPQYHTVPIIFRRPVRFSKGLYIQFVTAGSYVFVQYKVQE